MRRFSARLAARFVLIVLIVIVPTVGIIVYDQTTERRRAHAEAVESASRLARLAASEQLRIFNGVQRLLGTLRWFPGLREGDVAACHALLPSVLRDHPNYINIFVVNADGSPFCAASDLPGADRHSAAESTWFRRALETRGAVIGDYQLSLLNGRPAVVLAQPITDAAGRITRVAAAVISLAEINATFS